MVLLFTGSLNHILRKVGILAPDLSEEFMISPEESAFDMDFLGISKALGGGMPLKKKGKGKGKGHRFGSHLKQEDIEEEEDRLRKWEDGLAELSDMARHNAEEDGGLGAADA